MQLYKSMLGILLLICSTSGYAAGSPDFLLGAGDSIHISVFRSPEFMLDTRVNEDGTITYPLIGNIRVAGLSIPAAEELIVNKLSAGGFMQDPQVNITIVTVRGNLVSVLGQVNQPGLFPLDPANLRLSEVLALAGGVAATGGDTVVVMGERAGKPYRKEVNLASIYLDNKPQDDVFILGRDEIYVPMAPKFYIYGEVQRAGAYVLVRGMTVMQALSQGGGLTLRGTERNLLLTRTAPDGEVTDIHPAMFDRIQANDVIHVNESIF